MKKIGNRLFVAACLLLCLIPFAGMTIAPTHTTTENRRLVSFPEIKKKENGIGNGLERQGHILKITSHSVRIL